MKLLAKYEPISYYRNNGGSVLLKEEYGNDKQIIIYQDTGKLTIYHLDSSRSHWTKISLQQAKEYLLENLSSEEAMRRIKLSYEDIHYEITF